MEVKQFALELKADAEERVVEGLGSVFGNVDSDRDIVLPGAFARTLKGQTPAMLWQHKTDHPIGVWDEVRETPEGLYVKGRILETQLGNDVYTLAKAGALKGMSIGYAVKDYDFDKKSGIRQIKDVDLWEVSIVTFPANALATITRVKSRPATERELEECLRDAGYSRSEAKAIVSGGYKAIATPRDAGGQELTELGRLFKQFTNKLTS